MIGIFILPICILMYFLAKDTYLVALHSASGESRSLVSQDEAWVDRVMTALNEAIVARG
jgi:hypothetical protein